MGRKKNATSEMDVAEKQSAPLASRLSGLITDSDALRKYLDVSAQAINQYKLGISRPSLENLCKIADFYNVSVDYLLGRTGTKTVNEDIQGACKTTGLSENAIGCLQRALDKHNDDRRVVLNALLGNYFFYHLLNVIFECVQAPDPKEEILKIPGDDRFQNHSSKEISEALAANLSAKVISSTVEMLRKEGDHDGKH